MTSLRSTMVTLLVLPALALGACGGSSDKDKITSLVKKIDKDSSALCDNATDKLLQQLGGDAAKCKETARGYPNDDKIKGAITVNVSGSTATADFTTVKGKKNHVTFVKDGGNWKVDSST
ncbi:MAG: hypothetical protein JWM71_634 [Solirubrobacteraceae bacterium]|nr:hypothetical protein [Solirubrobacteraceae bacterium]